MAKKTQRKTKKMAQHLDFTPGANAVDACIIAADSDKTRVSQTVPCSDGSHSAFISQNNGMAWLHNHNNHKK